MYPVSKALGEINCVYACVCGVRGSVLAPKTPPIGYAAYICSAGRGVKRSPEQTLDLAQLLSGLRQ